MVLNKEWFVKILNVRKNLRITSVAVCSVIILASCATPSMRELADANDLKIGCAIQAGDLVTENREVIVNENFNLLLSENGMKWANLHPNQRFWNWSDVDHMVAYAEEHNMEVKGHPLVWHSQLPTYVKLMETREQGIEYLQDEISTVLERYKGKITQYDVVNEAINDDGTMRESIWYTKVGPDFIDLAFQMAHKADPTAKLIYNDYDVAFKGGAHADACYELVKGMVERGIPINAVGFQLHLCGDQPFNEKALRDNIKRYEDLGIEVEFSEVDVRIPASAGDQIYANQELVWKSLFTVALTEPNVSTFAMWGYCDLLSWIPPVFPGYGQAHLYDKLYQPKPVYNDIKKLLSENINK